LGTKANALYRDGCKLSQPLSNKSDKEEEEDVEETLNDVLGEAADTPMSELTPEMVLDAARRIIDESSDHAFPNAAF
jgi:ribonucleoside-diphosphate reductase alpha chain